MWIACGNLMDNCIIGVEKGIKWDHWIFKIRLGQTTQDIPFHRHSDGETYCSNIKNKQGHLKVKAKCYWVFGGWNHVEPRLTQTSELTEEGSGWNHCFGMFWFLTGTPGIHWTNDASFESCPRNHHVVPKQRHPTDSKHWCPWVPSLSIF